jgi:chemotaxis family two-component system sensor kinase Cph1
MTGLDTPLPGVELDACDREPVHAPASIQPQALLIGTDTRLRIVCHSAEVPEAFAGLEPGAPLTQVLADDGLATVLDHLSPQASRPQRPVIETGSRRPISEQLTPAMLTPNQILHAGQPFDVLLNRNNDGLLLFELVAEDEAKGMPPERAMEILRPAVTALAGTTELAEIMQILVRTARELTGFERVMGYRFTRDDHGEVIAEDASSEVPSFLGLHYPGTDIPRPVRALFLRNPLRLIVDREAASVPVLPRRIGTELDLGLATYRGLSPVHQAYLRNMDVGASMSVALLREGRLWGLIACHHRQPRSVSFAARQACEVLSLVAAKQLRLSLEREVGVRMLGLTGVSEALVSAVGAGQHLGDALGGVADQLETAVDAKAFAVLTPEHCYLSGSAPSESLVRKACAAAEQQTPGAALFETEHLAALLLGHDVEGFGGLMGTVLPGRKDTRLVWLRGQEPREVRWAGDPREPKIQDATGRLHPRASFALWKEARHEHCREWDEADERVVLALRERVVDLAVQLADQLSDRASAIDATNRQLAAVNEELERFVHAASHDLRAPLRAVGNITRWIEEDAETLSESARDHLGLLRSRVQRMETLLRDLLAYARAGRADQSDEMVALTELAREVVDELERPEVFRIEIDEPLPSLRIARVGVRQVLFNLLNNAIVHHDRADGHVRVRGGSDDHGIWLCVEDDGPGIPAADRERAFEMFQTLDQREGVDGSGLGLSLVRRELEAHGGSVTLSAAEPRGTRVFLSWPWTSCSRGVASALGAWVTCWSSILECARRRTPNAARARARP